MKNINIKLAKKNIYFFKKKSLISISQKDLSLISIFSKNLSYIKNIFSVYEAPHYKFLTSLCRSPLHEFITQHNLYMKHSIIDF